MTTSKLQSHILSELERLRDKSWMSGKLPLEGFILEQAAVFRDLFGPHILAGLAGEALLVTMHGRENVSPKCMAYWLEYKNDEEFYGNHLFGGIGGGSALKFGIYQRQADQAWITGSPQTMQVLPLANAIAYASSQRNELIAGAQVLSEFQRDDGRDEGYTRLQRAMEGAAPKLCREAWAHKYWSLVFPHLIDHYHSTRYQRYHLFKLLEVPPDGEGITMPNAPRFSSTGRLVAIADHLGVSLSTLYSILNQRDGAYRRYWKVGTTEGSDGGSTWPEMRDGSVISVGWKREIPDLSDLLRREPSAAKKELKDRLSHLYQSNPTVATRKAGEILNLAREMAESDLVLACEGMKVLGIGRIIGPYQYRKELSFPHTRPVEWLSFDQWTLPENEAPRTTVFEMGKYANNLIAVEEHLLTHRRRPRVPRILTDATSEAVIPMPPLSAESARIDSVLRRKGQVILYGPPGTGKTFHATAAVQELAARQVFKKPYARLSNDEKAQVDGPQGQIRYCTFHPGWNYEDFVEGLRPEILNGQMIFERKSGIFKQLCTAARAKPERHFYLIIDEINRGDLPRIFGELLTVIEYDKREQVVTLPNGQSFSIPKNVFLIGTMNTADRSVSLMDTALRRRFGFIEVMPDSSILGKHQVGDLRLGAWLDALNGRVRRHLKRDARNLQIGHAYLLPLPASVAEFARVLRDDIIPLLEEYCYNDFSMLQQILGKEIVCADEGSIREEIFSPNSEGDLIQSLLFEEMQPHVLDQEPTLDADPVEAATGEFEEQDHAEK